MRSSLLDFRVSSSLPSSIDEPVSLKSKRVDSSRCAWSTALRTSCMSSSETTSKEGMERRYPRQLQGSVPEWPKGADCKSAGTAFGGSNPPRPTSAELLDSCPARARVGVTVHHAARLHGGLDRRRPEEPEAQLLHALRHDGGLVIAPQQLAQRTALVVQCERGARVRDRGFDLRPVADDAGVPEQPLHVVVTERGDGSDVEPRERGAERLALAQDRDPREPRLERLEHDALEQRALVRHRHAPLVVVVRL